MIDLRNLIMLKVNYRAKDKTDNKTDGKADENVFSEFWESANNLADLRKGRDEIAEECHFDIACGDFDAILETRIKVDDKDSEADREFMRSIAHASRDPIRLKGVHSAYPLFIVREWPDKQKDTVDRFWNTNRKAFRFFTSVYLADDFFRCAQENPLDQLQRILTECNADKKFEFLIYETMHIAEFMVCWQSDSVKPVLTTAQALYNTKGFRAYTRTICALDYAQLDAYRYEDLDKKSPLRVEEGEEEKWERLSCLNFQVVQSRPGYAAEVIKKIVEWGRNEKKTGQYSWNFIPNEFDPGVPGSFFFGNEDYGFNLEKAHDKGTDDPNIVFTVHFYEIMHALMRLLKDGKYEGKPLRYGISHLQTIVGDKMSLDGIAEINEKPGVGLESNAAPKEQRRLQECCQHLLEYARSLEEINIGVRQQPWYKEFMGQVHMLRAMSESYIDDSICYLLLDGATLFCAWLEKLLRNPKSDGPMLELRKHAWATNAYLTDWDRLANHMMRSDAIMLPASDCIPPSDDLCTGVVEYCSAFFRQIGDYFRLQTGDDQEPRSFAHLLVPMHCRFTKTYEMFNESRMPETSLLFLLETPQQTIAEPKLMITMLGHEAAHYLGIAPRLQRERIRVMCTCAAIWLIMALLEQSNPIAVDFLAEEIMRRLCKNCLYPELSYFNDLMDRLKDVIFNLLTEASLSQQLAAAHFGQNKASVLSRRSYEAMIQKRIDILLDTKRKTVPAQYEDAINTIYELLRESYADIMMIDLLELGPDEYIHLYSPSILAYIENPGHVPVVCQRVAIVRQILEKASVNGWVKMNWSKNSEFRKQLLGRYDPSESANWFQGREADKAQQTADQILSVSDALVFGTYTTAEEGIFDRTLRDEMVDFLFDCLTKARDIHNSSSRHQDMEKLRKELRKQMDKVVRPARYFDKEFNDFLRKSRSEILDRLEASQDKDRGGYNHSFG